MDFGKKYRFGNFEVLKVSKSLSRNEVREIRKNYPEDALRVLDRGTLPYIRVSDISRTWAVEYGVTCSMFGALDGISDEISDDERLFVHNFLSMLYADTTVLGDAEYVKDRLSALDAFMKRNVRNDDEESAREDEDALKQLQEDYSRMENVESMIKDIKEVKDEQGY